MNDLQKSRITAFLNDELTAKAVYEVLLQSFLKTRTGVSVHELAAAKLAIDYLREGWKELERNVLEEQKEEKDINNIGL